MIFKFSLFIFFILLNVSIGHGQKSFSQLINRPVSELSSYKRMSYIIDEQVHFEYASTTGYMELLSIVAYHDTIVYVQAWYDGSPMDEPSTYIGEYADSSKLEVCQAYIEKTYGLRIQLRSAPKGFLELRKTFGLHCGGAGGPTAAGIDYQKLALSELSEKEKLELLSSIHPFNKLYGYLILKKEPKMADHKFMNVVKNSPFPIDYCYGCEGSHILTMKEVILEVNE